MQTRMTRVYIPKVGPFERLEQLDDEGNIMHVRYSHVPGPNPVDNTRWLWTIFTILTALAVGLAAR